VGRRFALQVCAVGAVISCLVGGVFAWTTQHQASEFVDRIAKDTPQIRDARRALADVDPGQPQTMLLIGDDRRKGESGQRSDTMILVRLDPDARVTSMLSLPRDLVVRGSGSAEKLNAAYAKGPGALITRLQQLLSTPAERFEIHHYVAIRFTAFAKAVNTFDCFYADVDRRYFNDNQPPTGGGVPFATIDVPAGYQRLCGEDSLDYVRSRHADNDVVREARQSHYLAEARAQMATSSLLSKQGELVDTIFRYVDTDIDTGRGLLGVVRLGLDVAGRATGRVELTTTEDGPDLVTTPAALASAARTFLHPRSAPGSASVRSPSAPTTAPRRAARPRRASSRTVATLRSDLGAARTAVRASGIAQEFTAAPVLVPRLVEGEARYDLDDSRAYDIAAPGGKTFPWPAYRLVAELAGGRDGAGQFYGVQGTTWKDPPVLELATDEVRLGGRSFRVEYDGRRIRRLIWRAPAGTYWVTNSLTGGLSNAEMRAVARSLTTVGR